MPKLPDIPVIGIGIGPGSQPDEDGELNYMQMPGDMQTYHQPILPEPDEVEADLSVSKRILEQALSALRSYQCGDPSTAITLEQLDAANLDFINQLLGEGEVSATMEGLSPSKAQESVLAGVWRVQHFDSFGQMRHDTIEVGDVPSLVSDISQTIPPAPLDTQFDATDPGIQNAPAILVELADHIANFRPGDAEHTVNLTLLPLTEGDVMLLGERLGVGPVTVLSRGYGNCRIGSTAFPNVWWIKYFNSQDALILNTIEVVDVPSVALAAPEDILDSAERLNEILEMYR